MTIFHRFCRLFPLFLLALTLNACVTGPGKSPWSQGQAPATDTSYGQQAVMPQNNAPAVKVAVLLPLSGANANVGQSMLQAAQLAVFDMGYDNFELMPQDTHGTAAGASAAAQAALQGGAQLILGPLFAEEVRAVKSTTAASGVNVIAFSTDWTLAGGNTYIMGFLPFGQVERIAQYAAKKGLKRAGVATGTDEYGTMASRSFESEAQENGIAISRALSDPNGYDSVFVPAGGAALSQILPRITNKSAKKLGTGLWDDTRVAAMPEMNGAWFAAPSPGARSGFESRYQSTYGVKPMRLASMAYDATALAGALPGIGGFTAANLTNPNGFAGVDGIIRFNKSGLVERGMAVMEIRGGRSVEIDPAPVSFAR